MNLNAQLLWAFLISVISLIGFSLMAIVISLKDILAFDRVIMSFIQGLETPSLTAIMKFFTLMGSFKMIALIAIIVIIFLYIVLKHRSELILFTIVIIGARILNRFLKEFFQRTRPDFHRLIEIGGYSFPSGHAMNAMAAYGILTFLLWRHISSRRGRTFLIVLSSLFILMIGISRIYLGVHYPSDIIAGYLASGFWVGMAIWIYQKYKEKRQARRVS